MRTKALIWMLTGVICQQAGAAVLFQDDFADVSQSGKNWQLEHGRMEQLDFASGVMNLKCANTKNGSRFKLTKGEFAGNFEIDFSLRMADASGDYAGITLRGDGKTYFVGMTGNEKHLLTMTPEAGAQYQPLTLTSGVAHDFKLRKVGGKLKIDIDGKAVGQLDNLPTGQMDILLNNFNSDAGYDNLVIRTIEPENQKVAQVLFRDDFADAKKSAAGWILEHGDKSALIFDSGLMKLKTANSKNGVKLRFTGCKLAGDVELNFTMRIDSPQGNYSGVTLRENGKNYLIALNSDEKYLLLNTPTVVNEYTPITLTEKIAHDIKIVKKSGKLEIWVDGKKIKTITGLESGAFELIFNNYDIDSSYDNLVIKSVVAGDGGEAVKNVMQNSSFEFSESPNIPEYWSPSGWGIVDERWVNNLDELWSRWRRESTPGNVWHGKYSMRLDAMPYLVSCYVNMQPKETYTFSIYLKGEKPESLISVRYDGDYKSGIAPAYKEFKVTPEWQRLVWTLPVSNSNYGQILIERKDDSVIYADAAQMELGKEATPYVADEYNPAQVKSVSSGMTVAPPFIDQAPRNDGSLSDPVWQKAARVDFVEKSGGELKQPTEAYLYFDKNKLYLGFRAFDSDMANLRDKITERDGNVWNDDCIEIFIGPSGPRGDWADYFHLGFNTSGIQYDAKKMDSGWTRDWQVMTKKFADRWEGVAELPFAMFDLTEFTQGDWTLNLARENGKIMEYSAWSPTFGSFHKSEQFGVLKAFPKEITAPFLKSSVLTESANNFIPTPFMLDGKPFFGYGLAVQSSHLIGENFFKSMKANDMNLLVWAVRFLNHDTEEIRKVLGYAEENGIKIAAWLDYGSLPHEKRPAETKRAVEMFKDCKAIIAWMVVDEPHEYPDEVKACLAAAKAADPSRPAFINVTPHGLGMKIADLDGDMLMIDRYVFHFDSSTLNDIVPMMKSFQKEVKNRPGWIFLQGMGYSMWVYRGPGPGEMAAQTYLSWISGATGVVYFSGIIHRKDTWDMTKVLAKEAQLLAPVFLSKELAEVTSSNTNIDFMARKYDGKTYVVAVNKSDKELQCVFSTPKAPLSVKDFFTNEKVAHQNNQINLKFAPYQRIVLEIAL